MDNLSPSFVPCCASTVAPPQVPLPPSVERLLSQICAEQRQPPADVDARLQLSRLGEDAALEVLRKISVTTIKKSLSGFIRFMAGRCSADSSLSSAHAGTRGLSSPPPPPFDGMSDCNAPSTSFYDGTGEAISPQLMALNDLEFRKAFLILNYIGQKKLEDVFTVDEIWQLRDLRMIDFEARVYRHSGLATKEDRCQYVDWDSGRTHIYHCHVLPDGRCNFKGPFLNKTRTLLQKELGDDNILLVKLAENENCHSNMEVCSIDSFAVFKKIAKEGIRVGLRRYRFFVFKDGGKSEKKRDPTSSPVKCYFVCLEHSKLASNETIQQARSLFMHVHTLSSISKYMIRFSLILSKTMSLNIDWAEVKILTENDVPCKDEMGNDLFDKMEKPLIHTDGTGYVSQDIAMRCPGNVFKGSCRAGEKLSGSSERELTLESSINEPPLLIQCRMFYCGNAVKGTLLVNKNLERNTIVIRRSMIKVEKDPKLSCPKTVKSLEIVSTSNKPNPAFLSRSLIALLNSGEVPNEFFLNLVKNALGDMKGAFSSKRTALKVLIRYGEMDAFTGARMLLSGIPLDEPYLQYRLTILIKEEKKSLRLGRIPISDSYYLMGTADPTGKLKSDEVCIILDSGQISGEVLVYRNPGLHFGDIHVLKAKYVKELDLMVGHSKYGIFFPTSGPRSLADEMAGGDFDGDMYWVSRNPQLLEHFKPSKPWVSAATNPSQEDVKPSDLSEEDLEDKLIELWLMTRFRPSYTMGAATDSWLALMDRALTIGVDQVDERMELEQNLCQLVDIYYDAIDAPKKGGQKIEIPKHLKAEVFPHYMEKDNSISYSSTSILGLIYDMVISHQTEDFAVKEITKIPCFVVDIPENCLMEWRPRYEEYRRDMETALNQCGEGKNDSADEVIAKYKQILYGAADSEESPRNLEDIFNDALAIYNITYDYAKEKNSISKCTFAWKVAGAALCRLYGSKQGEMPIYCAPSVLKDIFN